MRSRTLILLLLFHIIAALGVFSVYALHFGRTGELSSAAAWGAFGSYVGGILGPVLAYFALIAILATLRTQQAALRLSQEAATRERAYLERKERKEEWRDAIRDADRELNEHLNVRELTSSGQLTDRRRLLQHVVRDVLASNKSYDSAYADLMFAKYSANVNLASYHGTTTLVLDIWNLLDGFAENLTETDSRLLSFYISYFLGPTTQLRTIGAISDAHWKIIGKTMQRTFPKKTQTSSDEGHRQPSSPYPH